MDNLEHVLQVFGSWIGYAAPLLAGFIYMISKIEGLSKRLDSSFLSTNQRIDETIKSCNERSDRLHQEFTDLIHKTNERSDRLQQEFIELLKEVRNDRIKNRII
jgi:hypothetical protein